MPEVFTSDEDLDLKMNWQQLRELNALPGATVGGHSHTHAILSFLDPQTLAGEINTSLSLLRNRAAIGPRHYSYPEGLAYCYSPAVVDMLRQHGVRCCPSAEDGTNTPTTSPFELKRIFVT